MKRFLFVWVIILLFTFTSLKAETGLGLQFGTPTNVALSFRKDMFPIIGLGWNFSDNGYLAATIDYWILHKKIDKPLYWYVGAGANIYLPINSSHKLGIGLRAPVGLQWIPAKHFEIFGELAPYLNFIPDLNLSIQASIGFRYLF
jgi:hypothetical protein